MTIEGWTPRHTCLVDIGDERGEVRNVVSGRKQIHSAYDGGCNFRSRSCLLYPTGLLTHLPGICVRLTSLETLHIEGCATLHELPTVSLMTSLTSLILHKCALIGLPCLESLTAMWHLSLSDLTPLLQSAPLLSAARLSPFRRSFCPSCACLYCYQFTESSSCRRSVFNWATPVKLCSSVFCMLINCLLHQFLGSIQERVRVPH